MPISFKKTRMLSPTMSRIESVTDRQQDDDQVSSMKFSPLRLEGIRDMPGSIALPGTKGTIPRPSFSQLRRRLASRRVKGARRVRYPLFAVRRLRRWRKAFAAVTMLELLAAAAGTGVIAAGLGKQRLPLPVLACIQPRQF